MVKREKLKILVVDDERSNILALSDILKPMYSVLAAVDGGTALEIAATVIPDLILLDIIMPDMSGFQVLSEIKSNDRLRRIPIIFITGLDSIDDEEKGLALGAADYITKPFHRAIVRARVKTQLQLVKYIRTIERVSQMDVLTDLLNRRGFNERMTVEWNRAIRQREYIGVLMMDIDRFKNYNDTYGHLMGDACLQTVARIIRQTLKRGTDLAARWGGEEFIVLLPNTEPEGTLFVAEKIRACVEAEAMEGTEARITVSIGAYSGIPEAGSTVEEFISKADKALYAAKALGRNRVVS